MLLSTEYFHSQGLRFLKLWEFS